MTGLFNSFDLLTMLKMSFIILLSSILIPLFKKFLKLTKLSMIILMFNKAISLEIKTLLNENYLKGSVAFFLSIFFFIFMNNFLSLMSYIFSYSAHIIFSFSLGFCLWMTFILMGWKNNIKKNLSHLVPLSTPPYLVSFMVLVETVSVVIRPITLSVRLSANITAGHLLLSLISWIDSILLTAMPQFLMFILEMMVSFIQAYVFMMLLILYLSENN